MSNDIKNWAKKQTIGDRNAKVLLLELADCANDDGFCWHKVETLAQTLEMSSKTVDRGLTFLVKKNLIQRVTRTRKEGKFDSKNTQILIPDDDWDQIVKLRKMRAEKYNSKPSDNLTYGEDLPKDNLTHGEDSPQDNLSKNGQKPQDKMTYGDENHGTFCPSPQDNLTNGQFVPLNIKNKEVILEPLDKTLLGSSNPHTREESERETWENYLEKILKGICLELGIQNLPKPAKWTADIRWSYNENFTVGEFVGCFSELHREPLRKFPVTAANVVEALPKFALQMREVVPVVEDEPVEEFPEMIDEELPKVLLTDSERDEWQQMMNFFQTQVNDQVYSAWFKYLNFEGVDEGNKLVKISARQITKDWLTKNYDLVLEKALMHVGFIDFRFQWRVYR